MLTNYSLMNHLYVFVRSERNRSKNGIPHKGFKWVNTKNKPQSQEKNKKTIFFLTLRLRRMKDITDDVSVIGELALR